MTLARHGINNCEHFKNLDISTRVSASARQGRVSLESLEPLACSTIIQLTSVGHLLHAELCVGHCEYLAE